jgi:hypothetical protein
MVTRSSSPVLVLHLPRLAVMLLPLQPSKPQLVVLHVDGVGARDI